MIKPEKKVMKAAIDCARLHKSPVGIALAMGDQVFSAASASHHHSELRETVAEVIGSVQEQIGRKDLSGFVFYCTCEPDIGSVYSVTDVGIYILVYGCGCNIPGEDREKRTEWLQNAELHRNFMRSECGELFRQFSE